MTEDKGVGLKGWLSGPKSKNAKVEARAEKLVPMDEHRMAVLPMTNISPDPRDDYFADGLTEELISTISNISELSVISRTSVMSYKGTSKKVREIGRELEVGSVLEGSVRKAGNRMRITVQLINVRNDKHLWAQSYDRDFDDVFAIQCDIAREVADALKVRMLPNETRRIEKRPTKSAEAYALYLKGRYHWNERSKEQLFKAIEYFKQAVEIDPEYALAYSGMADCYIVLGINQHVPYDEAFTKGKTNALKAVRLDDSSAEAHTSLAGALSETYEYNAAEREFKRALELNSNYATCHQWYGMMLGKTGKLDESLREALLAQQLDPVSPVIHVSCGQVYASMEKYQLAEEQFRKTLDLDPNFADVHDALCWTYLLEGKYDEAEKEIGEFLRLTNNQPVGRALLGVLYAFAGKADEAKRILAELSGARSDSYVTICFIAAYLRMGDREKAIELVQKEFEEHANWLPWIASDPIYSSVRSHPKVVGILKKIGIGS